MLTSLSLYSSATTEEAWIQTVQHIHQYRAETKDVEQRYFLDLGKRDSIFKYARP